MKGGNIACSRVLTSSVKCTILVLKDITALVKLPIPGFPFRSFQQLTLRVSLFSSLNPGISDTSSRVSCAEAHGWQKCFALFPKVGNNEQK